MDKIKTGIVGLDKMFLGEMYRTSSTLIEGAPGTGKTTLGMQFIHSGITEYNEKGLYITFEYFPEFLYRDALSFSWDFKKLEKEGKIIVWLTSPDVLLSDLQDEKSKLSQIICEMDIKRVVIDTISQFQRNISNCQELRNIFNILINALKREGLTSFLLSETVTISGPSLIEEPCGASFIADNIVLLRFLEIESEMQKSIMILKARGCNHIKEIRKLEITDKGIIVKEKFSNREGILTGSPRKVFGTISLPATELLPKKDKK